MRRGLGAAGMAKRKDDDSKLQKLGQEMRGEREDKISIALEALKEKLLRFSAKHRETITADPDLCQQFLNVCQAIGLDPLVSDKSVWDGIFGGGRFLPEVSVQLLKVCAESREANGGVMELGECVRKINLRRGGGRYANVTESDAKRCVKELECLGPGILWIEAVNGKPFVFYAPDEIGPDSKRILGEIGERGKIQNLEIVTRLGWTASQRDVALTQLIGAGVVWVDARPEVFSGDSNYFLAP